MPRVNVHCHNAFSSDGTGSVAEIAAAAEARGIDVLCLTNHAEHLLEDGESWELDVDEAVARFRACLDEIERCRARFPSVEILFGAELEYRPEWRVALERLAGALPFDFLLGSVHVVDGLQISGGPSVHEAFARRSEAEVYLPYFDRVLEMVEWGGFDVVAHLDLVKRFGAAYHGPLDPSRYAEVLDAIFEACTRRRMGIEVNASGLVAACAEPFPGAQILARARAAGVPFVTLGTDGHRPEHVDRGLHDVERLARSAGFLESAVFRGRIRGAVPLRRLGSRTGPAAARAGSDDREDEGSRAADAPGQPPASPGRVARYARETTETSVAVLVNLDGRGRGRASTGIGFFDHMLETLARHALLDLEVEARGDLAVDEHHLVEDVGLTLGEALSRALGERRGIRRFGCLVPMDESLAEAALDLSGRPRLVFRARFRRERVGDLPTELVEEFFRALTDRLRAAVHLRVRYGRNDHHKIEAVFKAFALALRAACEADPRRGETVPSSKETLTR